MVSRTTIVAVLLLIVASMGFGQAVQTVWEKSASNTSLPSWMTTTSTERGFAYGNVGGNHRLYIVSRNGGNNVVIYNAVTGDSVGTLSTTGITGGTFAVNDVEVSDDGVIYVGNLTTASATSAFKVYGYTSEGATPAVALNYTTTGSSFRLGDKFTVVGSTADNSAQIWAATAANDSVLVFTTSDNGATFTFSQGIPLSANAGNTPAVWPVTGGFYLNGAGTSVNRYASTGGTPTATIPGTIIASGSNALRAFEQKGRKLVATFSYGGGNENARIADVTSGDNTAKLYYVTPSLGSNSNGNGTGDIDYRVDGDTVYVYVLSTNNGFGAYKLVPAAFVTFNLNTSTVQDTTKPSTVVQVRGSWTGWGDQSPAMNNVGGDYWTYTGLVPSGAQEYKYFVTGAANGGWESTNNRALNPSADTTLAQAYWSSLTPPYTPTDSVDVWFRVNMLSQENFNPSTDQVHVRGSFNGWSDATPLTREGATRFYSGQVKMPDTTGFTGAIEYKYTYTKSGNVNWESVNNRTATTTKDTTLYWVWWDNVGYTPPQVSDTIIVTFQANMARAISERGFAIGDTLEVRSGYNATAASVRTKRMARVGISTIYAATDTVVAAIGKTLNYQYYLNKNGSEFREIYFDFAFEDPTNNAAERRRANVTGGSLSVLDTATSNTASRRVPRFRNTQKLSQAVTVTYMVDARPAITALRTGKKLVATNIAPYVISDPDSVDDYGVFMNGPAVGGWDVLGRWGDKADTVRMFDDGTHGDTLAGDMIYTLQWSYTTSDVIGQEFKFGIGSYDNEGGFGNNHIENIDDSGPTTTIFSQFGSIDPIFYDSWDFDNRRAKSANVTFRLNTSSVPDTVNANTVVQVRGSWTGWGDASPAMTNTGGDYWSVTQSLPIGSALEYKYFVTGAGVPNGGWETTNNRTYTVTGNATLPVAYWSRETPVYTPTDSVDVWFRINMRSQENFNPSTDEVHVRGSFNGWSDQTPLAREGATYFYSGQVKMPDTTGFTGAIEYKFTYTKNGGVNWESINNRTGTTPRDTTLYWVWWDNNVYMPPAVTDTVVVTFSANLSRAIAERGFAIGDTIIVRSGYNSTAAVVREKRLARVGISTVYSATDTVVTSIGNELNYQYYLVKNGSDFREVYFDFNFPDPTNNAAERRRVTVPGASFSVQDTSTSNTQSRRVPRFRNTQKLARAVTVTYTVDARPAIYAIIAGKKLVATNIAPYVVGNRDSVLTLGVYMNGPAVGGWDVLGRWGDKADTVKMHDDGTHGDAVAGDSVFTLQWAYTTNDVVGQEFKFGVGSYDNEGGFGNNHIENIDDSGPTTTIASQFGSIDPIFYDMWDFDKMVGKIPTGVEDQEFIPDVYSLDQNFPNPFNPTTTIQFGLPIESNVTLKVYNTLGQEVRTVVTGVMRAGMHKITFDASNLSTGIYFYQIKAGDFTSLKKMVLVK